MATGDDKCNHDEEGQEFVAVVRGGIGTANVNCELGTVDEEGVGGGGIEGRGDIRF
jgi:hypothetical protein